MKLKLIAFILTCSMLLSSCTSYQYFTLASDVPQQNKGGGFSYENKDVTIHYAFQSDGALQITITNHMKHLVYVDWEKSSMVFDGESIPLVPGQTYFDGIINSDPDEIVSEFEGTLYPRPTKRYLPPGTRIQQTFSMNPIPFQNVQSLSHPYEKPYGSERIYRFQEGNTPCTLEYFLYLNDETDQYPRMVQSTFWVEAIHTSLEGEKRLAGNQFRLSKTTKAGTTMIILVLLGTLFYVVIAAGKETSNGTTP